MDLQKFTLSDGYNVTAEILTPSGTIRVEAEIMGAGLPAHIDSVTWMDSGADASMEVSQQLDDVRAIIEDGTIKAMA